MRPSATGGWGDVACVSTKKAVLLEVGRLYYWMFLLIFYHSENVSSGNHLPILVLVIVIFVYH